MDNKKVQVEIALKDNLSKQLDSLSSKVKKVAQDMQNSVRSMQNAFNGVRIGTTGIDSSISNIKKKLQSLGNESVEIDATVDVDTSSVDGLDLGGSFTDLGMMASMGGVSSSMASVSASVAQMSASIRQAFSAGVKDTETYQQKIVDVSNTFKKLQNVLDKNNETKSFKNVNFKNLKTDIIELTSYFQQFENEVEGANSALTALNSMNNIARPTRMGANNTSAYKEIKSQINTMTKEAIPQKGIEIPVEIKNLSEQANKVATTISKIETNKVELDTELKGLKNAEGQIKRLKERTKNALKSGEGISLDDYSKRLTRLTNEVGKHKAKMEELRKSQKALNSELGQSKTQFDKIQSELKETATASNQAVKGANKMKSAFAGLKGILGQLGLMFGIYQLVNFGKSCVSTASDLQEVANVINVTFGDSAQDIDNFAKTTAMAFGLSELSAKQYIGTIGSILDSSGVGKYTTEMSKNLVQMSGDLASFYNLSNDVAFEKLRAGIVGETEPLKALGINMSVANLEAYRLAQGINTAYSEMSQADQTMLRYNYLMQMTSKVQGDFANTQYSYSNSVRTLKNNFASLKAEIGTSMIACLAPVIKVIATIIAYLTALAKAFNNFLRSIGLLKGAVGGVGDAISSIGGSDTTSGLGGVSDGLGGVADSAGGASGAVKDLKKEIKGLMGIDMLNKLPEVADSASGGSGGSGSSGGGGGAGAGGIGDLNLDPIGEYKLPEVDLSALDRAMENIQKFIDWCKEHMGAILAVIAGLASGIATYFMIVKWDVIKASIMGVMDSIVGACTGIIGAISAPALAIAVVVGALVAGFTYLYVTCEEFRDRVNKVFTEVGQYIKKVYDAVIKPIGDGIKAVWNDILLPVLMALWQVVLDVVEAIWSGIESVWERTKPALDYMCEAFGRLWSAISEFYQTCKPVFDLIGSALKVVYDAIIKPVLQWVIETLINLGGTVIPVIVGAFGLFADILGVVFEVASTVIGGIIDFISEFAEACSRNFESVGNWFKGVFSDMKTNFEDKINNFKQGVSDFGKKCKDAWTGIKDKFATAWDNMKKKNDTTTNLCMVGINNFATKTKEHWSSISSWFSDKFNAIKNTCSNVCDGIKNFFSNTHTSITNTFNSIGTWFSNKFTEAKNGISNAFSNVKNVLVSPIENAKNTIKGIVDKICGFFSGARIRFPNIPLPHFSITPSGWSIGDLLKGSIPKLGISWYSQGGIFPSRTLLGVGDANNGRGNNPEAVLPLNVLWEQIDKFADKIVSGVMSNNNNNQDLTVNLLLDGKLVTATVVKNINNQTRLTGVSPLK